MIIIHRMKNYQYRPRALSPVVEEALRDLDAFLDEYGDRAPLGAVLFDTAEAGMLTRRIVGLPVTRFV